MSKFIFLIRHGETDDNVKGIFSGPKFDAPLNKTGLQQALKTAKFLHTKGAKIEKVYSSDYRRAKQTAALIAREYKLKTVTEDKLLGERDSGTLAGETEKTSDKKIAADYPKLDAKLHQLGQLDEVERALQFTWVEKLDAVYSQTFAMETEEQMRTRIKKFFSTLPHKNVAIVSHDSLITQMLRHLFGMEYQVDANLAPKTSNCHITIIAYDGKKYTLLLPRYNRHL